MKVKIIKNDEDRYEGTYGIEIDGKHWFTAGRGEPEDNCLARDQSFVYDIVPFIKKAYEAGKAGEELLIEEVQEEL